MGLISLNSGWGFAVSLCKTAKAYAANKRGILLSAIPILDHTCTTLCCQVSISSTQFLDPAHNQSYRKNDPPSQGPTIPSDMLDSFVIAGVHKRESVGMHNTLSGNVVSNRETTLDFRTDLSSASICCSKTETFHIRILNVMLDLIAFLSPQLVTLWLGELLNTISVFRLNKKSFKEGGTQYTILTKAFYIRFLNFLGFTNIFIKKGKCLTICELTVLWQSRMNAILFICVHLFLHSPYFFTLSLLFVLHKHALQKYEMTK